MQLRIMKVTGEKRSWGWMWLDCEPVGNVKSNKTDNRHLIKLARNHGAIAHDSHGKVKVENDGFSYVISDIRTSEPLACLCYGVDRLLGRLNDVHNSIHKEIQG